MTNDSNDPTLEELCDRYEDLILKKQTIQTELRAIKKDLQQNEKELPPNLNADTEKIFAKGRRKKFLGLF